MRLRYTGKIPVTFTTRAGEVEPETEFDVPDDEADAYTGRTDIEQVQVTDPPAESESAPRTRKAAKAAPDASGPTPDAPVATGDN